MFEKAKRSIIAGPRASTYRVCDSSATVPTPTARFGTGRLSSHVFGTGPQRTKTLLVSVVFLDDSQFTFEVDKSAKGSVLLEKVFQHLELSERDYFGLQFDELLPPPEVTQSLSSPHLRWIEASKPIKKQIRFTKPELSSRGISSRKSSSVEDDDGNRAGTSTTLTYQGKITSCQRPTAIVYFRVKFFVDDPAKLKEEYTRYHVFLQLRKDILEGRLTLSPSMSCLLASYAVQSELGDYNPDEHDDEGNYLKNIETNLLLLRDADVMKKIVQLHKMHKGQTPADAEFNFLMNVKRLEAYGINFHRVKDNLGKEIEIGVSSLGISVFHNGIKMNTFSWFKITKIGFKRKNFFIQVRKEMSEEYDTMLFFDCWSYRSCKKLWKACVEHHAFFRLSAPPLPNRRPTLTLFSFGSRFRYSGRTEYQTREEGTASLSKSSSKHERRSFFRSPSKKFFHLRQTLTGKGKRRAAMQNSVDGSDESRSSSDSPASASPAWNQRKEVRLTEDTTEDNGELSSKYHQQQVHQVQIVHTNMASLNRNSIARVSGPSLRTYDKVHQTSSDKEPRQAWAEDSNSDDDGGFLDRTGQGMVIPLHVSSAAPTVPPATTPGGSVPIHISLLTKGISKFADDDENSVSDDGTVSIRLEPDVQGKFGFNIKGGFDMGCPVLVSRVAPGTPADQGYPRLSEGDQLIQINGTDTSAMMHSDIVSSIRHAASKKELLLRVRPNVYSPDDFEEPPFQYVPDVPPLNVLGGNDYGIQSELASSMMLLAEAIESDSISSQFDIIFRKKTGMSCEISKLPENLSKNRYRDISPYDSTRVILNDCPSGDYINASYVTMEIAASGIVNRYIATQGPLPSTTNDFWIMMWETQSPLIVMLTPICEQGRIKCHHYWPHNLNSPVVYHNLEVTTTQERHLPFWIEREFKLKNLETSEELVVVQLMYQSWPDHGVPNEPTSFIRFIEEVRKARLGTVEPTVIHCSAGIGRTGVLILMETAECLIEANQPVYPVNIVTQMRLQRPLMIQTPSQYRFVCECVLRVFQKGIIRPLPEFCNTATSPPVQRQMVASSSRSASIGSRARAFCSSWFHSSAQQQQLHSGA